MITLNAAAGALALALTCGALMAGVGALLARSLFVMCMHAAAAGALAAAGMLALGAGDAALTLALSVAVWTPVLLLAAMLLSVRTAGGKRRAAPWLGLLAAGLAAAVMLVAVTDLEPSPVAATPTDIGALGPWLAPLLLAAAAACVALLGYGERGALRRHTDHDP